MIKVFKIIFSIVLFTFLFACQNDEPESPSKPIENDTLLVYSCGDSVNSNCLEKVLVNPDAYDSANSIMVGIGSLDINNNCLDIEYVSSGCSGNTWVLTLIDSGYLASTNPPIRKLKWDFINQEACLAVFSKNKSFDLCPLKIPGQDIVVLQIEDSTLIYRY